ncbi:TetR family transcriptional regulator [Oerskovia sp. M15]
MDEIAAASGTSKSIIYRYFEDKTGLQIAIGASVVGQMHDALTQAAEAAETCAARCARWSASTSR